MKRTLLLFTLILFGGLAALAQPATGIETQYPAKSGHLRFFQQNFSFNNVYITEIKTDTVKMYNEWNQIMTIAIGDLPAYLTAKAIPAQLKPQQKGVIIVSYDGSKRNDWGFVGDRFTLNTNDSVEPQKTIGISAFITEDFTKITPEQLKVAPVIKFDTTTVDFGTIKEGDTIKAIFVFKNLGDSLLRIRKVKHS
jgi:hypothetical protein